jgi:hypothetical protein
MEISLQKNAEQKYLFLKGNSAQKIYNYMSVTLGVKRPSQEILG